MRRGRRPRRAWLNARTDAGVVDIGDKTVFDSRGGVDHSTQRRLVRPDSFEDHRERSAVGDISSIYADLGTRRFEFSNSCAASRRSRPSAAH